MFGLYLFCTCCYKVLNHQNLATFVCNRYNISPMSDMNFGAMLVNSKKSKTFVIENRSDKFELKYVVSRVLHDDGDLTMRAGNA